jgi:hypothetical protein
MPMTNYTPELLTKARAAKSAEELFELAKANEMEITEEDAKLYFAQLNANGAVADDELDAVAGGAYSVEEWNQMSTEEREAAQQRSIFAKVFLNAPCELD